MKKSNIKRLIRALEGTEKLPGLKFNMSAFCDLRHDCGTVACIGGTAAILAKGYKAAPRSNRVVNDIDFTAQTIGRDWLGLDEERAHRLFFASNRPWQIKFHSITAEQAVEVLKKLLKTGSVDWSELTVDA